MTEQEQELLNGIVGIIYDRWNFTFARDRREVALAILALFKQAGYVSCPACVEMPAEPEKPIIVCLCGSTRFSDAFQKAQLEETLVGKIVLTIGCNMKSDTEVFSKYSDTELLEIKAKLNELHKRKIDLADEVLILNVGGYMGESTRSELEYATQHGKIIRFLEAQH